MIIVASVALQILTITVPGLRTMLGLVPLDGPVLGLVAAALVITIAGAETWSRRAVRRSLGSEARRDIRGDSAQRSTLNTSMR